MPEKFPVGQFLRKVDKCFGGYGNWPLRGRCSKVEREVLLIPFFCSNVSFSRVLDYILYAWYPFLLCCSVVIYLILRRIGPRSNQNITHASLNLINYLFFNVQNLVQKNAKFVVKI
jgi:hypothetical protein